MGEVVREIMKLLCLAQAGLAKQLGIPYDTVRGWSSGRADPSPENRALLAAFMRTHAKRLEEAAEELEG